MKKNFYLAALSLAIPAVLQQLLANTSQMADNIMVGSLGDEAIAGVYISNQLYFIFQIIIFGVVATGGIFISQYKGAKNDEKITESFRISVLFATAVGLIFFILIQFFPYQVIGIFVNSKQTIAVSLSYFKYIKYTFLFFPLVMTIGSSFRYYGIVKLPMYVGLIGVSINIVLNYLLIQGNLGFPALGVEGGAIATLIARLVELSIWIVCSHRLKTPIYTKVKDLFKFEKVLAISYIKKGYPLLINEIFWSIGVQTSNVLYAKKITENVAAMGITTTLTNIIFVGMGGLSVAISIIIGNHLGNDEFEKAYRDGKKLMKMGSMIG
ncbi:MAG: MATE family efflux transporter, partial [Bacilli bacterium]